MSATDTWSVAQATKQHVQAGVRDRRLSAGDLGVSKRGAVADCGNEAGYRAMGRAAPSGVPTAPAKVVRLLGRSPASPDLFGHEPPRFGGKCPDHHEEADGKGVRHRHNRNPLTPLGFLEPTRRAGPRRGPPRGWDRVGSSGPVRNHEALNEQGGAFRIRPAFRDLAIGLGEREANRIQNVCRWTDPSSDGSVSL